MKINKTGGDLINKKSRIRKCRRKKHPEKIRYPPILFGTLEYYLFASRERLCVVSANMSIKVMAPTEKKIPDFA